MKNEAIPLIDTYSVDGVEFVVVKNNVGLEVTFANLGGAIYSIKFHDREMVSQVKDVKDFLGDKVRNGKVIGRVAGRIKGNELKIDKKAYKLADNDNGNVLHGGKEGISTKIFSHRVFSTAEHVHVVYTYFSKAGESGFPGNALFEVHYIVPNNRATVKAKLLSYVSETCPVSMSIHTYFSLGEENLDKLAMKIRAKKYLDIKNTKQTNLITVTAKGKTPEEAQKISQAVVDNFLTLISLKQNRLLEISKIHRSTKAD